MAGGHGIDRFPDGLGDFGKGELAPDAQDKGLALLWGKLGKRCLHHFQLIALTRPKLEKPCCTGAFGRIRLFSMRSAVIAPEQIDGGAADRRVKQRIMLGLSRRVLLPKADETRLHSILRIGSGSQPLPGKEQQARRHLPVTGAPGLVGGFVLLRHGVLDVNVAAGRFCAAESGEPSAKSQEPNGSAPRHGPAAGAPIWLLALTIWLFPPLRLPVRSGRF